MDSIFKRAYKETNNFTELWGMVLYLFHIERGLLPSTTIPQAVEWYKKHYKKMLDMDKVKYSFDSKVSEYKKNGGEIPEWDGSSGVEELKEQFRKLLKKEEQRIFNEQKRED